MWRVARQRRAFWKRVRAAATPLAGVPREGVAYGSDMDVEVKVQQDHLERLVNRHRRSAIRALAELVWNALDGDATKVEVKLSRSQLTALTRIRVSDNGHGITHEHAKATFGKLGDSWKKKALKSPGGRQLHGREGEGRYAAFALGSTVTWTTRYRDGAKLQEFNIVGSAGRLRRFEVADKPKAAKKKTAGTEVVISDIDTTPASLVGDEAADRLAELFALYLKTYPEVRVVYDGTVLDPSSAEERVSEYVLEVETDDGDPIPAEVTIIEWKRKVERALHLCDGSGFALASRPPGIQAPGFEFTAYLKCGQFRDWAETMALDPDELNPNADRVINAAKEAMRSHFRERAAEKAKGTVEEWKQTGVYPFAGAPGSVIEEAERQVFDVVALNINEYLPDFAQSEPRSKKLSLRMLRSAIERSPTEARQIIQEVLDLPREKQEELAGLLERTKLSAVISAAKLVGDRLDFLAGLEAIIFDPVAKKLVKERTQLHRIVAEHTWLFGEEFNLSVDDQGLDEVLTRHLHHLGKERTDLAPVVVPEGVDTDGGIVDLMLSRKIPQPKPDEREHLVVELKRPSRKLNADDLTQIEKYAFAVAEDERFLDTNTRWVFWLVSNDLTAHVRRKVTRQSDRPDGLAHRAEDQRIEIWVKTWGQIVEAAQGRLRFFKDKLEYEATHDTGLEYLRTTHAKYLPDELVAGGAGSPDP